MRSNPLLNMLTLLIQGALFFVTVLIVMGFIWTPLVKAMDARKRRMAEFAQSASEAAAVSANAISESKKIIAEARQEAFALVEDASKRGIQIIEDAREKAIHEANAIVTSAQTSLTRDRQLTWQELEPQVQAISRQIYRQLLNDSNSQKNG